MVVLTPQACDDSLPPRSDGGHPPRGHTFNSFLPCPCYDKKNHLANKWWKQFGKLPIALVVVALWATLALASLNIHTLPYHVTFTLIEYETLHHSRSIDASSLASLASLLTHPTLGTCALRASTP